MLTLQEIRQLKDQELAEELLKNSAEFLKTKMDILNGYSKDSHKLHNLKEYIARLKTVKRETELAEAKKAA